MSKAKKAASDLKRTELARTMYEKLRLIQQQELAKEQSEELAWETTLSRFDQWVQGLIEQTPQEKALIISALRQFENEVAKVRGTKAQ